MLNNSSHRVRNFYYVISSLFFIVSCYNIMLLFQKPDLPFDYIYSNGSVIAGQNAGEYSGLIISKIGSIEVNSDYLLELLIDREKIGNEIYITFSGKNDSAVSSVFILVPFYKNAFFIFISAIAGLLFFLPAIFVITKKPDDYSARVLFWVLTIFGLAIMTSPAPYSLTGNFASIVVKILHFASYTAGSAAFYNFILSVSGERENYKKLISTVYIFCFLFCCAITFGFIRTLTASNESVFTFLKNLWYASELILAFSVALGTLTLYRNYRRLNTELGKKKVKWIFWGIYVGVFPFILFFVIPTVVGFPVILAEEILLAFLIVIPVTFSVAVVKYHILDIEIIIRKSIVYSILLFFIFVFYLILIFAAAKIFDVVIGESHFFISVVLLFFVIIFLNPLKEKIEKYVDKKFFRQKYDFEIAVSRITSEITKCLSINQVADLIINELDNLIPVERIAFIIKPIGEKDFRIFKQKNYSPVFKENDVFNIIDLNYTGKFPCMQKNKIEPEIDVNLEYSDIFEINNIAAVIPLVSDEISGTILLGNKLSDLRYSQSDINLLNVIAANCAITIKRLQLEENLIREGLEKENLKEISEMKSFVISAVSHELQTPLTSIQMFTETLLSGKIKVYSKTVEYLNIIHGESERLKRLINNLLDISRIEKGVKTYNFRRLDLKEVVESVVLSMKYEIEKNGIEINSDFIGKDFFISADSDSVSQAIINLITNAVKYSRENKTIRIVLKKTDDQVIMSVQDHGIGILQSELNSIFDSYYRSGKNTGNISGTGIGLTLVKHIVNAHNAKIEVESEPGQGSTFKIIFNEYKEKI